MKRVLVTGGAGFIGSHLAEFLTDKHFDVVVIDNLTTGNINNISHLIDKIEFIQGCITDTALLKKYLAGVDIVFHLAAIPSVQLSFETPLESNRINIDGTLGLLAVCKELGVKRVVFASSSSVYGDSLTLPKVESMPINPKSPYALTKAVGEFYCKIFNASFGLETVSLRYFNVFGPRQNPASQYSAVIPSCIWRMSRGENPMIFGDGTQSRDFTYVDNVVKANFLAMLSKRAVGEIINIGCGENFSINTLLEKLNSILGTTRPPIYQNSRTGDVKHSLADINKAKDLLGYIPYINFEEGLKRTINSFTS